MSARGRSPASGPASFAQAARALLALDALARRPAHCGCWSQPSFARARCYCGRRRPRQPPPRARAAGGAAPRASGARGAHALHDRIHRSGLRGPDRPATWLDRTVAAGAQFVLLPVDWASIAPVRPAADPSNPANPAYNWGALDAAVRGAATRGLTSRSRSPAAAAQPGRMGRTGRRASSPGRGARVPPRLRHSRGGRPPLLAVAFDPGAERCRTSAITRPGASRT